MPLDYEYKTKPFPHQDKIFQESAEKEFVSLLLKPGLGKTKIIIDKVSYLYIKGKINALLVVAPNGVHLNWSSDEIPVHMPDAVQAATKCFVWHSSKSKTKKAEKGREALLKHQGLSILLVAYEATITPLFKTYMKRFFAQRKTFMTLDESHRIKGRGSKCKLTLVAMGDHAQYRRILTGTPLETPVDLYAQVRFLSRSFWKDHGFPTSTEFDAFFCVQVPNRFATGPRAKPLTVGYKNLDVLKELVAKTGYSMTLEDAGVHLPPVTYSKRYHEMFPEQRRVYENLVTQFRHEFEDGLVIDCEAAITRLLRLQQVVCGYLGTGPGEPIRRIDEKKNPRLEMVVGDILDDLDTQGILWCRFLEDVNQLAEALGKRAVRYDGSVDNDGRALAKKQFQAGDVQFMVMTSAGAEGHTLLGAKCSVFYSNSFRSIQREQMEGRTHYRIGQTAHTNVIDVVCEGTVDNDIVAALKEKFDIASMLTGDRLKRML
jgi:SNF2 family DNA or RNA helicase